MNLNYNSFFARLYRRFYDDYEMPRSLCQYFWMLIFACLMIIPFEIIGLPFTTYLKLFYKGDESHCQSWLRMFISIGLLIFIYFALYPLLQLFIPFSGIWKINDMFTCVAFDIILCFFGVGCLINHLNKKGTLLKSYINAKKNKICPKITWKK